MSKHFLSCFATHAASVEVTSHVSDEVVAPESLFSVVFDGDSFFRY